MTDRPPDTSPPAADTGDSAPAGHTDDSGTDRFDVLVERSLRGDLSPAEQQELGALLASSPQLAELARTLQQEDRTMQTMIQSAETTFDPERARRSIDASLNEARTQWRLLPIFMVLIAGGMIAISLIEKRLELSVVLGTCVLLALILVLQAKWRQNRSQRLAAEAASGMDGLAAAYSKRAQEVDRWTMTYRLIALAAPAVVLAYLIGSLFDESGSTVMRWVMGIVFVIALPNAWFAFNRRHVERVRARMLGHRVDAPADRGSDDAR